MTDRELMQMALDALEHLQTDIEWQYKSPTRAMLRKVEKALRAALAQPEQEPVACPYCHYSHTLGAVFFDQNCAGCVKRMTIPPQREWQGLTDEEYESMAENHVTDYFFDTLKYAHAIEAKLKEKNT